MVCWRIWKNLKNFEILWKVDFIVKLRFNFKNYSWVFPVKSTAKLTLNVGRHGWARKTFFFFTLYCLKRSETAFLISLNRKRWLSVKKDDRSSHQLCINKPNFSADKGVRLSLDIWLSRKALKCLLQNISLC